MLEYFTYKKVKKHQHEKKPRGKGRETLVQTPPPLLNEEDERFLERIMSAEGTPPPLPARPTLGAEAGDVTGNVSQMVVHDKEGPNKHHHHHHHSNSEDIGKGREGKPADSKKENTFAGFLGRKFTKRGQRPDLKPKQNVPAQEAGREEDDLTSILDDLDLSATNNRAFSLSAESQDLVKKFNVIFKDMINGVPTAYDDLVHLLNDSEGTLSRNYEKMPGFLQKLITQLPDKLTKNIAPELLAVAAESQGHHASGSAAAAGGAGLAGAAKSFFTASTLKDLVTKPGAVMGAFKAIMNALKLRWPAFLGTNVLLSLGLFILISFFWYCHKRGREVRIERENAPVDPNGRIIEIVDDGSRTSSGSSPHGRQHHSSDDRDHDSEDDAAMLRRRARRAAHEKEKEERRRKEEPERDREDGSRRHSRHRSVSGSRPSHSRQGSNRLQPEDHEGKRSRSSRGTRESRDKRDKRR
ncbi:hypothetical protein BJ875DRAFT_468726 [Amylocarpus encephaloides]|uniref:Ring-like domain-containing protein n=1 Tax=Amylocarpus encephaloides TaxID=45428 RepID=A0A9P8C352_9HELO|nr:hypothetical protein BJ875DRAFT_468726 [Amylocarpus encephaloides]